MPSWNELLDEFSSQRDDQKQPWLVDHINDALSQVGSLRGGRNVILYGSAFLQKPQAPQPSLAITHEDMNGLMSVMFGMDWSKGLSLVIHTPGGSTNAAESIVAYLRSKFDRIEAIVPALSMSAGTMISLSTERIVMGRQSQLGPIDPQMPFGGRYVSARALVDQFEWAVRDIVGDPPNAVPGELQMAHVWAPILQTVGPSGLQEAKNALEYGELMVARWLTDGMFKRRKDRVQRGARIAAYFNDAAHRSHGRRIDAEEALRQGVLIERMEKKQTLQEAVLTAYHLMTILFEQSPTTKILWSSHGRTWLKNWVGAQPPSP